MKKFLTVLLVIAVMFTFSFGTAFAAGTEESVASAWFASKWTEVLASEDGYDVTAGSDTLTVDGATFESFQTSAWSLVNTYRKANDVSSMSADDLVNTILLTDDEFKLALVEAQYNANYADYVAMYDAIDTSVYSTEKIEAADFDGKVTNYNTVDETYVSQVEKYIADKKDALETTYKAAVGTTDYTQYLAKATLMATQVATDLAKCYYDSIMDLADDSARNAVEKLYRNGKYILRAGAETYDWNEADKFAAYTTDAVTRAGKGSAADIAAVKALIEKEYAKAYGTTGYKTAAEIADLDAWKASMLLAADYGIVVNTEVTGIVYKANMIAADKEIAALKEAAEKYAAEKDGTGALVRDAATIDKLVVSGNKHILNAAKAGTYADTTIDATARTAAQWEAYYEAKIKNLSTADTEKRLAFLKDGLKAALDAELADVKDDYYPAEYDKLTAVYNEYKAAVDAAETEDAINAATTKYTAKIDAIRDADEVDSDMAAAITSLYNDANAWVTYKNTTITSPSAKLDPSTLRDRITTLVGESGYRTLKDAATLKDKALEIAKALPTAGQVATGLEAVEAARKALPATSKVTVADQAAIEAFAAALDAYYELNTTALSSYDTDLTNYVTALADAYVAQEQKKVNEVASDDVAINALRDEIADILDAEIFEDLASSDARVQALKAMETTLYNKLYTGTNSLIAKDAKAVEAKINAIPVKATAADKATVEVARKAYDEFVAKWNNYDDNIYAPTFIDNYAELKNAEAVLGLNQPDPEENAKAYVQDLSIKARSVKTSKGVKVTIKADVQPLLDNGFTVEYKFYRSTKSNKNFGTAKVTKTTNTYLNTSGVKGTKYYYKAKLVVKNAAGEVVATTPLTQCLYATRTF